MSDETEFLAAIALRPGDDLTRLVYADWLEERGDDRASYLRLVVEISERIEQNRPYRRLMTRYRSIADQLEQSWRDVVGKRFRLRLNSIDPNNRINAIVAVRGVVGLGLANAKTLVESTPIIVLERLLLEVADRHRYDLESSYWPGHLPLPERLPKGQKCCSVSILNSANEPPA